MTLSMPASPWFWSAFGTFCGGAIAVSTARIDDADGKRVAMASGSAMISEGRPWPNPTGN